MATIVLTYPDNQQARIIDGIAGQHNYQATIPDPANLIGPQIPNPESKGQFAKRMFIKFGKESVKAWEATQAANAARDTAASSVETTITLT